MDRSYAEPLDVRTVAAVAHLSEAHFIRSFRAAFGETPHRYLQRRRVERSMFLLPAAATASYHEGHAHQVSQRRKRAMITKLNVASIMVLNKDQALDFYVNKLGLEKGQDVKQGSYRWLTVRVPGDVTEISLEEPGPPVHDEATAAKLRELITKGALGGLVFKADDETEVLAKIAEMTASDRAMGERVHAIVKKSAPHLSPKLWYGQPAYARDGKIVCFFQPAQKFKTRYATFGFSDEASLDEGNMWPTAFALTKLTPADEARIGALVKKAAS